MSCDRGRFTRGSASCFVFVLAGFLIVAGNVPQLSPITAHTSLRLPVSNKRNKVQFVPGEILVRFRPGTNLASARTSTPNLVENGGRRISLTVEPFAGSELVPGLHLARVASADTWDTIAALKARDDVLYAEPNYLMYEDTAPNDPSYPEMYSLKNTGQLGGTAGADIDAESAWNITTGSNDVVVGVIDTGIDIDHPDLQANIWTNPGEIPNNGIDDDGNGFVDDVTGWDFYNNDKTVFDDASIDRHGTHVAGTIGAVGNNGRGVVGVNWRVKIMPLKFIGSGFGSGPTSAAISAIDYARKMAARGVNIRVLNNSWGGDSRSQSLLDAISALNGAGILFVAAAGNNGTDNFNFPHYPSNYDLPNIISVASTDRFDSISSFSNFGARTVTVGAPGSDILSTTPNDTYSVLSGTSMATPHVSGAAALIVAAKPDVSARSLAGSLSYSGDVIATLQGATRTGRRLNVFKSIQSAQENDTTPPAVPAGFRATPVGGRAVSLVWAAPGDDGTIGTAANYDIFFTNTAPNAERILLPSQFLPAIAGTPQNSTVLVPYRNFSGTITLRTFDNAGNFSDATATVNFPVDAGTDPYVMGLGAGGGLSVGGDRLLDNDNVTIFQGDDRYRSNYSLPFGFPFFGQTRNQLTISTNGVLYFSTPPTFPWGDAADPFSAVAGVSGQTMIAGLWDDLVIEPTARTNDGIYIVKPNSSTIIFRWQGATYLDSLPVKFEIELRRDGSIVFRYGDGNTQLFPVVGISAGEPDPYVVASLTSETVAKNLTNAQSVSFMPRVIAVNPIDDARTFVRQHYLDFLSREPDQAGWDYWTGRITECGADWLCIHQRRIEVSAAFFIELEFQETGYVVYRLHRATFGTWPNAPTRANLTFATFIADRSQLVAGTGLLQSTINLANSLVQRTAFKQIYPDTMTPAGFVNKLFDTANLTAPANASQRLAEIAALSNGSKTRAQVLLDLIEIPEFKQREFNPAFVLMQYFGYLRRDADQVGYDSWLDVLNNRVPNNFAAMVCAFLTSAEYQQRFSTTITRTNRDCAQ